MSLPESPRASCPALAAWNSLGTMHLRKHYVCRPRGPPHNEHWPKHRSIDFSFSRVRRATPRKLKSAGKQPSTLAPTASERRAVVIRNRRSRSPNAYFSRLFTPALQHARETLSSQKYFCDQADQSAQAASGQEMKRNLSTSYSCSSETPRSSCTSATGW